MCVIKSVSTIKSHENLVSFQNTKNYKGQHNNWNRPPLQPISKCTSKHNKYRQYQHNTCTGRNPKERNIFKQTNRYYYKYRDKLENKGVSVILLIDFGKSFGIIMFSTAYKTNLFKITHVCLYPPFYRCFLF